MYLLYLCIYWLCTPKTSSISSGFSGVLLYREIKYLSIYLSLKLERQCPIRWHSNDAVTMQQGTCNKWTIDQYDVTDTRERLHKTCRHHCTAVQHTQHHGNTAMIPRSYKMNNVEYICTKCLENFATEEEYNFHWENNHPVHCEMEMLSLWNGFRQALWTLCP